MDKQQLIDTIQQTLASAEVLTEGEDCCFSLKVISDDFEGLRTLARQQKILNLFKRELQAGELHALTVKAYTSVEWQQQLEKQQPVQIQL